jgi:baculoviral IAP repeat-containing protein 6
VSIQSLILVEQPYFNEPGYEQRGDMAASKAYNANIREKTVQWAMLDQLRKPPAEFAEPIRAHFRLRGPFILRQIDAWIAEATGAHASTLRAHRAALEVELAKL